MPWDLMARLLEAGAMQLEKVVVNTLRENTFFGSLCIRVDGKSHEIDARPSDAITLALDVGAPIFLTDEVWGQAEAQACVLRAGDELAGLEAVRQKSVREGKAEADEKEWRSFRALPRQEHPGLRQRVR